LIYGGGVGALAAKLKVSFEVAHALREQYFSAMPGVKKFMREVPRVAEARKFVVNWFGRRCHLSDPEFSYKMPNALIQGGCADITKIAIVRCHKRLAGMQSRLLLPVHDELLFKVHYKELSVVPELQELMNTSYAHKLLPMDTSVEHSWKNWHDSVPGLPSEP
jgi:DNA polymerase-1